jgi:phosphate transport system permease protein
LSPFRSDALLLWALRAAAALAGGIVLLILAFLAVESIPALRAVGPARFFTDPSWHPAGGAEAGRFNLTPMVVGTLAVTAGAVTLAAPLGLASALFCRFYAPRPLGTVYRRLVELLAGIPSVVYGFWGLVVLAPLIRQWQPPGQSLLAGILILTVMILPTVALLSESSLRSVPRAFLQGAAALGLSRWATIRGVALPAARGGIFTAVLLATGRAIGETMAVLMVMGNLVQVPGSIFDPVRALTANIALELGYAMDIHRSALFFSGLVLMGMIVVLVGTAEWTHRQARRG